MTRTIKRGIAHLHLPVPVMLMAGMLASCGAGDGLGRYPIQGTVTFDGQPVEMGAIFFEPTASVGAIAPTVYLPVRDGKYEAEAKDGPVKGTYNVVVGGTDQSKHRVDSDGITHSPPLFRDYKFQVEIPLPNNKLDVEVPDSQALSRK